MTRAADRCPNTIHSDYVTDHRCQLERGHDGDCLFGAADEWTPHATGSSVCEWCKDWTPTVENPCAYCGRDDYTDRLCAKEADEYARPDHPSHATPDRAATIVRFVNLADVLGAIRSRWQESERVPVSSVLNLIDAMPDCGETFYTQADVDQAFNRGYFTGQDR